MTSFFYCFSFLEFCSPLTDNIRSSFSFLAKIDHVTDDGGFVKSAVT